MGGDNPEVNGTGGEKPNGGFSQLRLRKPSDRPKRLTPEEKAIQSVVESFEKHPQRFQETDMQLRFFLEKPPDVIAAGRALYMQQQQTTASQPHQNDPDSGGPSDPSLRSVSTTTQLPSIVVTVPSEPLLKPVAPTGGLLQVLPSDGNRRVTSDVRRGNVLSRLARELRVVTPGGTYVGSQPQELEHSGNQPATSYTAKETTRREGSGWCCTQ